MAPNSSSHKHQTYMLPLRFAMLLGRGCALIPVPKCPDWCSRCRRLLERLTLTQLMACVYIILQLCCSCYRAEKLRTGADAGYIFAVVAHFSLAHPPGLTPQHIPNKYFGSAFDATVAAFSEHLPAGRALTECHLLLLPCCCGMLACICASASK